MTTSLERLQRDLKICKYVFCPKSPELSIQDQKKAKILNIVSWSLLGIPFIAFGIGYLFTLCLGRGSKTEHVAGPVLYSRNSDLASRNRQEDAVITTLDAHFTDNSTDIASRNRQEDALRTTLNPHFPTPTAFENLLDVFKEKISQGWVQFGADFGLDTLCCITMEMTQDSITKERGVPLKKGNINHQLQSIQTLIEDEYKIKNDPLSKIPIDFGITVKLWSKVDKGVEPKIAIEFWKSDEQSSRFTVGPIGASYFKNRSNV